MRIGPFRPEEMERLADIFDAAGVPFEMEVDEALKAKILDEFHQKATVGPRIYAGGLDLRIVFITLPDADFPKVQGELEKFGIAAPSDGSYELAED